MNSFNNIYGYLSASAKPKRGACINVIIVASRERGKKSGWNTFFVSFYDARIRREEKHKKCSVTPEKSDSVLVTIKYDWGGLFIFIAHTGKNMGGKVTFFLS